MLTTVLASASAQASWQQDWWLASLSPQQSAPVWLEGDAQTVPKQVPLGSLWKLLVYQYSVERHLADKPYQCHIGKQAALGDEYCCSKNESVNRDTALARSCGAYFEPKRLQLDAQDWQQYWQQQAPEITWLQQLNQVQASTQTTVAELLKLLSGMTRDKQSVQQARVALSGRLLQPQWSAVLPYLGGAYRFKTYTWQHPQYKGAYFGGAAGWLADGTAFWLGGTGGSREVMLKVAPILAQRLPVSAHAKSVFATECVVVNYFKRYPIARIYHADSKATPALGPLRGRFVLQFKNGNVLNISSNGELSLAKNQQQWQIIGQLDLPEYVARVLDREADATITEAAKALSIAARSYLYQNAQYHQGCWQIDDDSSKQRVSAHAASPAARAVVAFSEGLSLSGSPIYYHQNKSGANVLNWQTAVQQAQDHENYLTILHTAYPQATWRLANQAQQCELMPAAAAYLKQSLKQSRVRLQSVVGLEQVPDLKICKLDYGNPFADSNNNSIYIRDWRSENDRISLWHEYLHLALRFHPNGSNETYIENLAQQLAQRHLLQ
jgi:uncharacterized protein YfaQ (DUF2300 family)